MQTQAFQHPYSDLWNIQRFKLAGLLPTLAALIHLLTSLIGLLKFSGWEALRAFTQHA